jgi:endonuclease YncB( thermonuclease family)
MFLRKYIILLSLIVTTNGFSGQFDARVIKVIDGDTIWVKSANKHVKIRLSYIDAPELKQKFGIRSKNYLTNLIQDKSVQIDTYRKDRYNRIIGEVYIHNDKESVFVNAKLIKSGHAWVYKRYRNNQYLINLEDHARANEKGVWSTKNPIEPWVYRKK